MIKKFNTIINESNMGGRLDTSIKINRFKNESGQNLVEYSMVVGVVLLILVVMTPMIKRGSQAMIKLAADQIGNQAAADRRPGPREGHLINSFSVSNSSMKMETLEFVGDTTYMYDDVIETDVTTYQDLGFTETEN